MLTPTDPDATVPASQAPKKYPRKRIPHPLSFLTTLRLAPKNPDATPSTTFDRSRWKQEFKEPIVPVAKGSAAVLIFCLLIHGITTSIGGMMSDKATPTPTPIASAAPSPSPVTTTSRAERLKKLGISVGEFTQKVDRVFYTKHPELNQRRLTNTPADESLRSEWNQIADRVLSELARKIP
jgi:hypothetical protein